jgi:CheY-like chemotaxis protein
MVKKLNCVLLIDDSRPTNVFHKREIEKANCAETIRSVENGIKALEYLKSKDNGEHPKPDLIFLDINMPGMNGWEFLEEYEKLDAAQKGKVVLIMLTTSLNPDDEKRANEIKAIDGFRVKPLKTGLVEEVLNLYFLN